MPRADLAALRDAHLERERVLDRRTALTCAVLANCFRGSGQRPFQVDDFMPGAARPRQAQTKDDLLNMLRAWTVLNGGKVVVRNG